MTEHTVKAFAEELEQLSASIAEMGGLVEKELSDAISSLARRDTALAEATISTDARIDEMERQIETRVVRLLALRQPMGVDLRDTISALKIAGELERAGDLAKNLAKRSLVLAREQPNRLVKGLERIGRLALSQLKAVLDAYVARDAKAAIEVWRRDEEIDELYNSLFREFLTYMMEDPRTISVCTHLLFIAKNMERIGDHATNIAENLHFVVTGAYISRERPKGDTTSTTTIAFGGKAGA